jgi:hypothetical protein
MLRLIALLIAVGLVAAWFTRPDMDQAEAEIRATILNAVATEDIKGKDAVSSAALMGCRLSPETCYELVRSGLETTYEDRIFYAAFTITGFDRRATCYGAFATFFCPGGFAPQ